MLKDSPGSLIVINNLASFLADHKTDKDSLQRAHNLAVALKSSQVPQFQDTLGWVEYQSGNYAAAIASLEPAAQKLPNLPLVHYHLGMSYLAAGDQDKANSEFKKYDRRRFPVEWQRRQIRAARRKQALSLRIAELEHNSRSLHRCTFVPL